MTGPQRNKIILFRTKAKIIPSANERTIQARRILLLYSGETKSWFRQAGHSKGLTMSIWLSDNPDPQSGHFGERGPAAGWILIEGSLCLLPSGVCVAGEGLGVCCGESAANRLR
jgi:hypothetical protein